MNMPLTLLEDKAIIKQCLVAVTCLNTALQSKKAAYVYGI